MDDALAYRVFSLIASCLLHDIDPETYLTEIIRIVPLWPKDRFLELAPKWKCGTEIIRSARAALHFSCRKNLALGAVPVAAGVVRRELTPKPQDAAAPVPAL